MSQVINVYRDRTNVVPVNVGFPITTDVFTSQIRSGPSATSALIATWTVAIVDAPAGELTLTLDNSVVLTIAAKSGYMDLKRVVGGEPIPVFEAPLEVYFRDSITI